VVYPRSTSVWLTVAEIVCMQLSIIALVAGITQVTFDATVANAIIWGSCAHIIPNLLFATRLFKERTCSPQRFLRRFYSAEVLKILLTVLLLALVYQLFAQHVAAILIGYGLTHAGVWFALPLQSNRRTFNDTR